jgi:hypothetical protein
MNVTIYAKSEFINLAISRNINDQTVEEFNEFFICIEPTGGPDSKDYFLSPHHNVLSLNFDDVTKDHKKWAPDFNMWFEAKTMRKEHADTLTNFIKRFTPNSHIHVYCTMGITRSKAVGDFIREELLFWDEQTPLYEIPKSYLYIKNLLRESWKNT